MKFLLVQERLKQHAAPGPDGLLFPGADGGHLAAAERDHEIARRLSLMVGEP